MMTQSTLITSQITSQAARIASSVSDCNLTMMTQSRFCDVICDTISGLRHSNFPSDFNGFGREDDVMTLFSKTYDSCEEKGAHKDTRTHKGDEGRVIASLRHRMVAGPPGHPPYCDGCGCRRCRCDKPLPKSRIRS